MHDRWPGLWLLALIELEAAKAGVERRKEKGAVQVGPMLQALGIGFFVIWVCVSPSSHPFLDLILA